jgi:HSP20 family molecular chaperone IbpA
MARKRLARANNTSINQEGNMARIEVSAVVENDAAIQRIHEDFEKAQTAIREHAYHVAARGRDYEFENWLQAEREVLWVPPCELVEQNGNFRLRAAVPGLEAKQIRLTALPESIVIEAGTDSTVVKDQTLHFSEFNRKSILRRIDLPKTIDAAGVKAKLERGILEVLAPKTASVKKAVKAKADAVPKPKRAPATKPTPRKTTTGRKKSI